MIAGKALYTVARIGVTMGASLVDTVVIAGTNHVSAGMGALGTVFISTTLCVFQALYAGEGIQPAVWIRVHAMGIVVALHAGMRRSLTDLRRCAVFIGDTGKAFSNMGIAVRFSKLGTVSIRRAIRTLRFAGISLVADIIGRAMICGSTLHTYSIRQKTVGQGRFTVIV